MRLNFYTCGEGFPLVILHGLFGSSDNWQTLSRRFKESYKVFAVDLRNHGASPHDDDVSYRAMAADVREFLETEDIPTAYLLGHSMGGKVAMQFANDFPDRVSKLVVADIAPKKYPRHHDAILRALSNLDIARYKTRSEIDRALAPEIPDTAVRQFLLKNVGNSAEGELRWKINLAALRDRYDDIVAAPQLLHPFTKPTLFLRGETSDYIQSGDESVIRQYFTNNQLATIEGAGHWLHAEKPDAFFEAVHQFLQAAS